MCKCHCRLIAQLQAYHTTNETGGVATFPASASSGMFLDVLLQSCDRYRRITGSHPLYQLIRPLGLSHDLAGGGVREVDGRDEWQDVRIGNLGGRSPTLKAVVLPVVIVGSHKPTLVHNFPTDSTTAGFDHLRRIGYQKKPDRPRVSTFQIGKYATCPASRIPSHQGLFQG